MNNINKKHDFKLLNSLASGLLAGIYPALYYCDKNFAMVNSTEHLIFFTSYFLILPGVLSLTITIFLSKIRLKKHLLQVNSFIGFFFFWSSINYLFFSGKKQFLLYIFILVTSCIYSYFLKKHHPKLMLIQGLLVILASINLISTFYTNYSISSDWKKHSDSISNITFKHRPNIYLLQPDGYVNFSELSKGYYDNEDADFEDYLSKKGFTNYNDFRSNYTSTLTSNSSLFMMKHHAYFNIPNYSDVIDYRKHIISENTVLSIFKNNGYETHFISEKPYLLANYPKLGFDSANFSYDEFGPILKWDAKSARIENSLKTKITEVKKTPQFYFLEFFNPSHISTWEKYSTGKAEERALWIGRKENANTTLKTLIDTIVNQDPTALILILSDHGGFVGLDYTMQIKKKTDDRDLIYSMFSSQLSILWPEKLEDGKELEIKSSVNVFRYIFSQLAKKESLLNHLELDESYIILDDNEYKGVYTYINEKGGVVFKKTEPSK